MANIKLDTAHQSQVNTPPANRRTIYDASSGEIIWKSMLAGFALGIGNMIATVLFFGIIAGLLLSSLQPLLSNLQLPTNQLQQVVEQEAQSNSLLPGLNQPTPTTTATPTTVGE